jgi:hypothetical protein
VSIRSIIARPTGDGFAGRYVHQDGHPTARVPILLTAFQTHFVGNITAATRFYLDDHPAGWLSLGTDFTAAPNYQAPSCANRCFCHGRDDEGPTLLTHDTVDPLWHEWIYLLRTDGLQIIRTDWRKCTQATWASHLLPWSTSLHAQLPSTLHT